jgi:hypothetical protein
VPSYGKSEESSSSCVSFSCTRVVNCQRYSATSGEHVKCRYPAMSMTVCPHRLRTCNAADGPYRVYGRHSVQPRMQLLCKGTLVAPIQCPSTSGLAFEEAVDELEQVVSMTYSKKKNESLQHTTIRLETDGRSAPREIK